MYFPFQVLTAIVATETGRTAFINNRGVHYLCEINIKQSFQCEKALNLLLNLLKFSGQTCWLYHTGTDDFNNLVGTNLIFRFSQKIKKFFYKC